MKLNMVYCSDGLSIACEADLQMTRVCTVRLDPECTTHIAINLEAGDACVQVSVEEQPGRGEKAASTHRSNSGSLLGQAVANMMGIPPFLPTQFKPFELKLLSLVLLSAPKQATAVVLAGKASGIMNAITSEMVENSLLTAAKTLTEWGYPELLTICSEGYFEIKPKTVSTEV